MHTSVDTRTSEQGESTDVPIPYGPLLYLAPLLQPPAIRVVRDMRAGIVRVVPPLVPTLLSRRSTPLPLPEVGVSGFPDGDRTASEDDPVRRIKGRETPMRVSAAIPSGKERA